MLKKVLAISGKPGLYSLISHGSRTLIVEQLDGSHKRIPVFGTDKVIALADIAMYTDEEEVPLRQVLNSIKEQEQGKAVSSVDIKTASKDELFQFMGQVLPTFDRDRVHPSDVKKLIQWYNILVTNGITDFEEETPAAEDDKAGEE